MLTIFSFFLASFFGGDLGSSTEGRGSSGRDGLGPAAATAKERRGDGLCEVGS